MRSGVMQSVENKSGNQNHGQRNADAVVLPVETAALYTVTDGGAAD